MGTLKKSFGASREQWRQALQNELDSFMETNSFEKLSRREAEQVKPWEVMPGIEPENEVKLASSCADVKDAFFAQCQCTLEKREVGLKLAARGFKEEKKNYKDNGKRSSKNVYTYTFPGGESGFVRLVATADKSRATL